MANTNEISKITKVTIAQKFDMIRTLVPQYVDINGVQVDLYEFCDSRKVQAIKHNSSPSKKKVINNSAEIALVTEYLDGNPNKSASEIAIGCGLKSTQKASAVLKAMVDSGTVMRIAKGKKVTFALA